MHLSLPAISIFTCLLCLPSLAYKFQESKGFVKFTVMVPAPFTIIVVDTVVDILDRSLSAHRFHLEHQLCLSSLKKASEAIVEVQ